jgi:hypothetical protein
MSGVKVQVFTLKLDKTEVPIWFVEPEGVIGGRVKKDVSPEWEFRARANVPIEAYFKTLN